MPRFRQFITLTIPFYSKRYSFPELPASARLDDISKLLNLDTKNLNLEQLGLDAIKEQHRINLQFSSDKCAVIPKDRAQVMLAAVSIYLHRVRTRMPLNDHSTRIQMHTNHLFVFIQALQLLQFSGLLETQAQKLQRDALKLINATITGTATTNLWQLLEGFFGVDEEPEEEDLQDTASLAATLRA